MFWITFNWDKFEYIPVLLERFFSAGRSPNIQSAIENIHLHQGLWYWLFLVDRPIKGNEQRVMSNILNDIIPKGKKVIKNIFL